LHTRVDTMYSLGYVREVMSRAANGERPIEGPSAISGRAGWR
jgi:hypothetical protein